MNKNYNYLRVAAASPRVHVADPEKNAAEIISECINLEREEKPSIIVFPELSVCGYTCSELFNQSTLYLGSEKAVETIAAQTSSLDALIVVGAPVRCGARVYNCAIAIRNGIILGIVPKAYLPGNSEFYEPRYFESGTNLGKTVQDIKYASQIAPIGILQLFRMGNATIGIEVCQDIWTPVPPCTYATLSGAQVILNLSASDEGIGKHDYRKLLLSSTSARLYCAYIYSACGYGESTTDMVWNAPSLIYESGKLLAENERYQLTSSRILADVDIESINISRTRYVNYCREGVLWADAWPYSGTGAEYSIVDCGEPCNTDFEKKLYREVDPHPFVPSGSAELESRCREAMKMQVIGLATRLEHIGQCHSVIGISGGLDSALALLVTCEAYDALGWDRSKIIAVTMPGFGTSDRTRNNAGVLMDQLGVSSREIGIGPACLLHFQDIGQDPQKHDLTYENVQARERTQILMDIAGKEGGIVVGTGDLSEEALGWCTYNGDHISMYNVNCDVPKTFIREIVGLYAREHGLDVLTDIVLTPVSPELIPGVQPTEDLVGPYELHDFFLYHFISGVQPDKIYFLARKAFGSLRDEKAAAAAAVAGGAGTQAGTVAGTYPDEIILKWLKTFVRRFFVSQFKRSCCPDGPKIGSIALSPRGDWRMSSDVSAELWLKTLEEI